VTDKNSSDDPFERSLELLAERVGDPATRVYARLFETFPEVEAEFVRDTDGAVRGEMLAVAFQSLLELDGAWGANLIRAEVISHDGFGVPPDRFAAFFSVLRDVCREALDEAWTPEIETAWADRLARVGAMLP
jgi:hemoglobin-like flavoprotein